MKRFAVAALAVVALGVATANAQVASWPPTAGALAVLCVYNTSPPALSNTNVGFVQCDAAGKLIVSGSITPSGTQNVLLTSQYPATATPVTAGATGTTAATVATLAASATKSTYICGFSITSTATAALAGTATVVGTTGGTMSYVQGVGVTPAVSATTQTFNPCIPSSAINTAVVITSAAAGVGGVTAVNAWGYQL